MKLISLFLVGGLAFTFGQGARGADPVATGVFNNRMVIARLLDHPVSFHDIDPGLSADTFANQIGPGESADRIAWERAINEFRPYALKALAPRLVAGCQIEADPNDLRDFFLTWSA